MKLKQLFVSLPLLAFSLDNVTGTIGAEDIGYRFDNWTLEGTLSGSWAIEKAQNLEGMSMGLDGGVLFDNFYLRGRGSFMLTLSKPNYLRMVGGSPQTSLSLDKKHGYNADAAFGHLFFWGCDFISFAPEVAFAYQSLDLTTGKTVTAGTPFVGISTGVKVTPSWYFALGFGYHFLGYNKADIVSGSYLNVAKQTKGSYRSTDLTAMVNFVPVEHWSIGVGYQFKYMFTKHKDYTNVFARATMQWITNTATFNLSYTL